MATRRLTSGRLGESLRAQYNNLLSESQIVVELLPGLMLRRFSTASTWSFTSEISSEATIVMPPGKARCLY
jgi:hypothetical protein